MRRAFVSLVLLLSPLGCGQLSGDDAGLADGAAESSAPDDSSQNDVFDWDGGVCNPNRPNLNQMENCDDAQNSVCQQWAQSVAISAYGYSTCWINPVTTGRQCNDPGCSPQCMVGQVCASSQPNGPRQCIQACAGL